MKNMSLRLMMIAGALMFSACLAVDASAQCCGQAVTSYYAPVQNTYFVPTAQQTVYTGWYPGYWLDRINASLWGTPPATTVVAVRSAPVAWPTVVSYAPVSSCSTCTASYAPAPCSTCSSYTTSYAPACSTCSTCSSCQTGCSTCSSCSAAPVVTQASYQEATPGCPSCSANAAAPPATYVAPLTTKEPTPAATPSAPASSGPAMPAPNLPTTPTGVGAQKPVESPPATAPPGSSSIPDKSDPYYVAPKKEGSTYFEAPQLFSPNDRTAQRGVLAPVRTAVYEQPVSYQKTSAVSHRTITAAQAAQDAIGWSSASK